MASALGEHGEECTMAADGGWKAEMEEKVNVAAGWLDCFADRNYVYLNILVRPHVHSGVTPLHPTGKRSRSFRLAHRPTGGGICIPARIAKSWTVEV